MNENIDNSIKQALEVLSKPDNLKNILDMLGNPSQPSSSNESEYSKNFEPGQAPDNARLSENSNFNKEGMDINMDLMRKAQDVMRVLDSSKDPRINLLTAITPFMKKSRQQAVNDCVQFLRFSKVLPVLLDFKK